MSNMGPDFLYKEVIRKRFLLQENRLNKGEDNKAPGDYRLEKGESQKHRDQDIQSHPTAAGPRKKELMMDYNLKLGL